MIETIILTNQICFSIVAGVALSFVFMLMFNEVMESRSHVSVALGSAILLFFLFCNIMGLVWGIAGIFIRGILIN